MVIATLRFCQSRFDSELTAEHPAAQSLAHSQALIL
jgi:hypothetical protein